MAIRTYSGILLDENSSLTLPEFCGACSVSAEWVVELVDEGVLNPSGSDRSCWYFSYSNLRRAHVARRLHNDLGLNIAGVALALDLLDEVRRLRSANPGSNAESETR